jgi:hypothetical protein
VDRIGEHRTSVAADRLVTNLADRGVGAALGRCEGAFARHVVRGVFARPTAERANGNETNDGTAPAERGPDGSESGSTGFDGVAFAQERQLAITLRESWRGGPPVRAVKCFESLYFRGGCPARRQKRRVPCRSRSMSFVAIPNGRCDRTFSTGRPVENKGAEQCASW